ncbi:hypothetical protein RIO-1_4 [Pseudoalteromonas phage RIO-1]|uniref:Uncharacterized protein n=1 Tax=Pseudoalteromonas phage RIO-1 TaxID=1316739 RepID=R4JF68_9CAUD|nr:hypothetical protein RIO-1_4 [Pseudoalteromonas phage RIO-1]AGK87018.1 hypothetical protein RIO-1_4 [Pseudoalteromonas phage RIO-1]
MPNNKRKHYDVIIAWANGAEVEAFSSGSGVWVNCPHPNFFEYMQYRIKQRTFTESAWYPVEVNRELGGSRYVAQYVQGSFKFFLGNALASFRPDEFDFIGEVISGDSWGEVCKR